MMGLLGVGLGLAGPLALAAEDSASGWPPPIHDSAPHGLLLVDQLEIRGAAGPLVGALDAEGWYGGDQRRLRYRLEGAVELAQATGEGEVGLAYSHLVGPWVELQLGVGAQAHNELSSGAEARLEAGVEWVIPYDFDLEAFARVSHRGRLSARLTAIKELQLSQRLILQARAEATAALQPSVELDTPRGLEAVGGGLRLRYEARRELAPYLGAQWGGGMGRPSGAGGPGGEWAALGGLRCWW